MALGFLNLKYESIVLPYEDEETPIKFCGKKMLPIWQKSDGSYMNESLDIIAHLDTENKLGTKSNGLTDRYSEVDQICQSIGKNLHSMAMPYWIYTFEFNDKSRAYFLNKKEPKRGPMDELQKKRDQFVGPLTETLNQLSQKIGPFFDKNQSLNVLDLMLGAHMWGVFVVPELQIPVPIYDYLMRIKAETNFNYHQDYFIKR